jgi:hypothetical protein
MDATTTLTVTHVLLTGTLIGFLLAWMVTFAVLALRSHPTDARQSEESTSFTNSLPVTSAPTSMHVITLPTTPPPPVQATTDERGNTGEMEVVSVG